MDRNLGASQVAESSNDANAYGDLYQWGRGTDGHEKRTSGTTSKLSDRDIPGHDNFITTGSSPYDWRSPQNDNLWQSIDRTNKPCPGGYRLPTEAEWEAERQSWSSNDAAGAFDYPLKLPMAGHRANNGMSTVRVPLLTIRQVRLAVPIHGSCISMTGLPACTPTIVDTVVLCGALRNNFEQYASEHQCREQAS